MSADLREKELIQKAKAGDESSFESLILGCQSRAFNIAIRYLKNEEDAMDALQESFIKIFRHLNSFKEDSRFDTWVYRIVVNTSIDFLRKQKKLIVVEEEALCNLDSGDVDDYQDIDLQAALEALPDNYRSIVILRYFEDLKIEEIAEILNENVNTVKTRLYKSLKALRIKIEEV